MKTTQKLFTLVTLCSLFFLQSQSQEKFFTKAGNMLLDATAKNSPEEVTARNNAVTCVLDTRSGNIQLAVLMKGFQFERALMQEHFNENYVESDQYPRAEFRGMIEKYDGQSLSKDGTYNVSVKGNLTFHGITREINAPANITVEKGAIRANSNFVLQLKDYNISVPTLVSDKLSNTVKINLDCNLKPL